MLIGLTGGIASGKSTVAARMAEHGAIVIDADALAREVVAPGTPALAAIAERFGPRVIAPGGSLDRAALGAVVFGDEAERRALEAITHPAIRRRMHELVAAAHVQDPDAVVVYDIPLLVETGANGFDQVVVVDAPLETRIERLVALRGMDEAEARARAASQASDDARRAVADHVIDASGSLAQTLADTDRVWIALTADRR